MRRACIAAATVFLIASAHAQTEQQGSGWEVGVRYWLSSGMTRRAHDASSFDPTLGNPTSRLEYDDMWANSIELYGRKTLGEKAWIKGYAGLGRINTGTFTDQDFVVIGGSLFYQETLSGLSGKLNYGTIDLGREVWRRGQDALSVFAGYQQWNEQVTAYGFWRTTGVGGTLSDSVPAVANELTWRSMRLGLAAAAQRGRTKYAAEVAWVPYATYRNEDSHFLRQSPSDLGPVPNVIGEGRGDGWQLELEVRRVYPQLYGLEFGLGLRWWNLASRSGDQSAAGLSFPLVELKSERLGGLFTVGKSW
jgi:hypothetical protein